MSACTTQAIETYGLQIESQTSSVDRVTIRDRSKGEMTTGVASDDDDGEGDANVDDDDGADADDAADDEDDDVVVVDGSVDANNADADAGCACFCFAAMMPSAECLPHLSRVVCPTCT